MMLFLLPLSALYPAGWSSVELSHSATLLFFNRSICKSCSLCMFFVSSYCVCPTPIFWTRTCPVFRTLYGMILNIGCTPFPYLISSAIFFLSISSILSILYLHSKKLCSRIHNFIPNYQNYQIPYYSARLMTGEIPSILDVRPSVCLQQKFSYFPPLVFSDFLHQVSL